MQAPQSQYDNTTAIRIDLGAIFVSLELSRATWLVTSLSPGGGEKMSKHVVQGGASAARAYLMEAIRPEASEPSPPRRSNSGGINR